MAHPPSMRGETDRQDQQWQQLILRPLSACSKLTSFSSSACQTGNQGCGVGYISSGPRSPISDWPILLQKSVAVGGEA
jgi:hypothetical protein